MDRRTWLQLLGILSLARQSHAQERPQQPMRVSKDQVQAALALLGLEFKEPEIEMMLQSVNRNLYSYEAVRKIDIPLDTEPAFTFFPGLPNRVPAKGPARFETTIGKTPAKAPANLEDLAFLPVTELAPLLRSRAVSSTDLTRMYLARMKKYSPNLLCLITLTEELALEQAAAADREIQAGDYRGPLHGIPYGLKDLFDTKGIATTWGAEPFEKRVPASNATCVERLRQAGAVLIAKLSMGALAQGDLWFNGRTKTPWSWNEATRSYERGSSGSSAGSASATAAGLVAFALGTETLGSIVSPCIQCGTTGLRPTYGRVSRHGAMALSWTMDKIGPICRSVEDCAIVLHAIYGPDGFDRSVTTDPFHWEPRKPLASLKVGILQKAFDNIRTEADKKVYTQALDDLKKAGVSATPVQYEEELQGIRYLLSAEGAAAFDDITRDGQVRTLNGQGAGDWPNTFRASRLVPAVEYVRAQRVRTLLVERFEKFMADWDAIVIPPQALLTTTNLTGNPQVVMKCGFADNAPRSISFLGRIYDEGSPLRVALAYEQATGWYKKNPTLVA
jgi:Asp-tRNA(Asn)/Glu-tRNA(Gln) amidotransferase A subunit family amidase